MWNILKICSQYEWKQTQATWKDYSVADTAEHASNIHGFIKHLNHFKKDSTINFSQRSKLN